MSTKRFIAKHGLDNNNQTITNVADPVNPGDVATKSVTDSVLSVAQSAFDAANNVGPQIQPAYEKANLAYSLAQSSYDSSNNNLVYVTSVNSVQNTNISIATNLAQGGYDKANSAYDYSTYLQGAILN